MSNLCNSVSQDGSVRADRRPYRCDRVTRILKHANAIRAETVHPTSKGKSHLSNYNNEYPAIVVPLGVVCNPGTPVGSILGAERRS